MAMFKQIIIRKRYLIVSNLIKIKDVADKYGKTARTLRYYEDMGFLKSTRNNDYAYRMYDQEAIKRLEQIYIFNVPKREFCRNSEIVRNSREKSNKTPK